MRKRVLFMACLVVIGGVFGINTGIKAQQNWYAVTQEADPSTGLGGYTLLFANNTNDTVLIMGDGEAIIPFATIPITNHTHTIYLLKDGSASPTGSFDWGGYDITNLDYMDANNISTTYLWSDYAFYAGNTICLNPSSCNQYMRTDSANTLTEIGYRAGANEYSYIQFRDDYAGIVTGDVFTSNLLTMTPTATVSYVPITTTGLTANLLGIDETHTGSDGITTTSSTGNQAGITLKDTSASPISYSVALVGGLNQLWILPEAITVGGSTHGMIMQSNGKVSFGGLGASSSQLNVDGNSDIIQMLIQGHSTQTSDYVVIENQSGTDLVNVNSNGTIWATHFYERTSALKSDIDLNECIQNWDYYLTSNGEINHTKFCGYVEEEITDYSRPELNYTLCDNETNVKVLNETSGEYYNVAVNVTGECFDVVYYPHTTTREGTDIGYENAILRQAVYNQTGEIEILKEKIKDLEARILTLEWRAGL